MADKRKDIIPKLSSLGCAYQYGPGKEVADPEKIILDCMQYYWTSNDIIFMVYGLLTHRIAHLIHIKRLISLVEKRGLDSDELVVLLVLSEKLMNEGHTQFGMVLDKLKKRGLKMKVPPKLETEKSLIKKWGQDPEFAKYGVEVRKIEPYPPKKLLTLKIILQSNRWLKLRALIGVNYRADIVYFKFTGKAENGYQAMKLSGSSTNAAYEIWKTLEHLERI